MKPIVTDTYDFPTLIRRGYVYVGKSARTVDRALSELMAAGQVEFRGAPKNGGYFAIDE